MPASAATASTTTDAAANNTVLVPSLALPEGDAGRSAGKILKSGIIMIKIKHHNSDFSY